MLIRDEIAVLEDRSPNTCGDRYVFPAGRAESDWQVQEAACSAYNRPMLRLVERFRVMGGVHQ